MKTNDIAKLYVDISFINIKIIQDSSQKSNEKVVIYTKWTRKKWLATLSLDSDSLENESKLIISGFQMRGMSKIDTH